MDDCIFCKIIDRQAPSAIVFENDRVIIFKDHRPKANIHLLVCPKAHYPTFMDTPNDEIAYLLKVCHALAKKLGVENGFRMQINNGPRGGQIVYHTHVHFLCWLKSLPADKIDLDPI